MRRLFALVILLVLPVAGLAEPVWNDAYDGTRVASLSSRTLLPLLAPQRIAYSGGGGGAFAGGPIANPITLPDGASGAGNLALSFTNDTGTGHYRAGANDWRFEIGGQFINGYYNGAGTVVMTLRGSGGTAASGVWFADPAPEWRLGFDVPHNWSATTNAYSGSPAAGLKIYDATANILRLTDGSTGRGRLDFEGRDSGSYKDLSEGSATGFAEVDAPQGAAYGGEIVYTVVANDGTDYQATSGRVPFSVANKAGTLTIDVTANDTDETTAPSAGTLTVAFSGAEDNADNLMLKCDATSSLTQTLLRIY